MDSTTLVTEKAEPTELPNATNSGIRPCLINLELAQRLSKATCTLNISYGCEPDGHMWVGLGCRGHFVCGASKVQKMMCPRCWDACDLMPWLPPLHCECACPQVMCGSTSVTAAKCQCHPPSAARGIHQSGVHQSGVHQSGVHSTLRTFGQPTTAESGYALLERLERKGTHAHYVAFACMARNPCAHPSLKSPLFVLYDSQASCGQRDMGPRAREAFGEPVRAGKTNKLIPLLAGVRRAYDAAFYIKMDSDTNTNTVIPFRKELTLRMPSYMGSCQAAFHKFPFFNREDGRVVPYAQGSIYSLSQQTLDAVLVHAPQVRKIWYTQFLTHRNRTRKMDEDALVGAIAFLQGIPISCYSGPVQHGCEELGGFAAGASKMACR